jgi:hypothetical protein
LAVASCIHIFRPSAPAYDKFITQGVVGVTFSSFVLVIVSYTGEIKLSDTKGDNSSGLQPAFILCIFTTFISGMLAAVWERLRADPEDPLFYICSIMARLTETRSSTVRNIPLMAHVWIVFVVIMLSTLCLWIWLRVRRLRSGLVAGQSVSITF